MIEACLAEWSGAESCAARALRHAAVDFSSCLRRAPPDCFARYAMFSPAAFSLLRLHAFTPPAACITTRTYAVDDIVCVEHVSRRALSIAATICLLLMRRHFAFRLY